MVCCERDTQNANKLSKLRARNTVPVAILRYEEKRLVNSSGDLIRCQDMTRLRD